MPGPAQQKICPRMDTMHSFYAAAFDLDGTLLDSLGDLAEAGNKALRAFGYSTHPVDAYRHFVGSGLEMLILRALPDGEAERLGSAGLRRLVETAGKYYARDWAVHTLPYPGVCEVLSVLQTRGVPLAVVTNKPHEWTHEMLTYFFAGISFAYVQGAAPDVPHKPDPFSALQAAKAMNVPPQAVAFIGDSDVDMFTARNAGMGAMGAVWGCRGADELGHAGADVLLQHPLELLPYLKSRADRS